MLVLEKRDSTSNLAIKNLESSITSLANSKLFMMVNSLAVIGSKIGTKLFGYIIR